MLGVHPLHCMFGVVTWAPAASASSATACSGCWTWPPSGTGCSGRPALGLGCQPSLHWYPHLSCWTPHERKNKTNYSHSDPHHLLVCAVSNSQEQPNSNKWGNSQNPIVSKLMNNLDDFPFDGMCLFLPTTCSSLTHPCSPAEFVFPLSVSSLYIMLTRSSTYFFQNKVLSKLFHQKHLKFIYLPCSLGL